MTGDAVAATTDGELQPALTCQRDNMGDIGSVLNPDDERWAAVEATVEDGARLLKAVVLGRISWPRTLDENSRMAASSRGLARGNPWVSCRLSVMI